MAFAYYNLNHQLKIMTKEIALKILELKKTKTTIQVAKTLNLSFSTVRYWIKRLEKDGFVVHRLPSTGRKPLKLK